MSASCRETSRRRRHYLWTLSILTFISILVGSDASSVADKVGAPLFFPATGRVGLAEQGFPTPTSSQNPDEGQPDESQVLPATQGVGSAETPSATVAAKPEGDEMTTRGPPLATEDPPGGIHWAHDHPTGKGGPLPFMQSPEAAIVMAAAFVGVALVGYFALVCWRRTLERKYGNRELLVEEEEIRDADDYRNYVL